MFPFPLVKVFRGSKGRVGVGGGFELGSSLHNLIVYDFINEKISSFLHNFKESKLQNKTFAFISCLFQLARGIFLQAITISGGGGVEEYTSMKIFKTWIIQNIFTNFLNSFHFLI